MRSIGWIFRRPALHRLDLSSGNLKTWKMPETIGCLGLRAKGGAVVALRNGFHFFDFDSGRLTAVTDPEAEPGHQPLQRRQGLARRTLLGRHHG